MSVFESTLQTLLAHTETLGLNEGDYLLVCNAMKDAFQKKPEDKEIHHESITTEEKSIKMNGFTFKHLESRTVHYVGATPDQYSVRVLITKPNGSTGQMIAKGLWSDYIQKMIRFLAPMSIEQTCYGLTQTTTYKEFMQDCMETDIMDAECEALYRASDSYQPSDDDHSCSWRGEYHRERFVQQYRVL